MTEQRWFLATLTFVTAFLVTLVGCVDLSPRDPYSPAQAPYAPPPETPGQAFERKVRTECAGQGTPLKYLACRNRLSAERL